MAVKQVQIGVLLIPTDEVFRNEFEVAAWYQDVKVPAGEYPIYAYIDIESGEVCRWPLPQAVLPGVIVASDYSPLFGGVPIGSKRNEDVGKPANYVWTHYAHSIAHNVLEGRGNIKLLPYAEARIIKYEYNGEKKHTYGLFVELTKLEEYHPA